MQLKTRHWDRRGTGGLTFTELGLGTAPLANLYRAVSDDDALAAMQAAWDGGVRHYDTAPLYGLGLAETRLNRFLRDKPRDSYTLSTKIGRLLRPCPAASRDGIGKWFEVPNRQGVYDYSATTARSARSSSAWSGWASTGSTSSMPTTSTPGRTAARR